MKEITTDRDTIESIIQQAAICRIGLAENGQPYVVPVCFGYQDGAIYFHSGQMGKKMDILRRNDAVCFEIDVDHHLEPGSSGCKYSMTYRSVIGFGHATLLEDSAEKRRALDVIMAHYQAAPDDYPDPVVTETAVVKITIDQMTAKIARR